MLREQSMTHARTAAQDLVASQDQPAFEGPAGDRPTDGPASGARRISRRSFVAGASALGLGALAADPLAALAKESGGVVASLVAGMVGGGEPQDPQPAVDVEPVAPLPRPSLLAGLADEPEPQVEGVAHDYELAYDFSNVTNFEYMYLSDPQMELLRQNGFYLTEGYYDEFFQVYETNRYDFTPNFVTVDAMMHTYHLYFSHLLKTTERVFLAPMLEGLSGLMYQRSMEQLEALRGTEWETAAVRNVALFAVGLRLIGDDLQLPDDVAALVEAELALIGAASSIEVSALTGDYEDYSQYIVRGYYEGDPALEGYFRAMMWYGRRNFKRMEEDLDRSALLITLALDGDAFAPWSAIYQVTSFFAGASDDCGYYEYRPLVDEAYGPGATVADLPGNEGGWALFHELTAQTRAPQINSVPGIDTRDDADHVSENQGFRFMGQRFSVDAAVFQQLIYNRVGENDFGEKRMLPDALDIPAAFGSDEALAILTQRGATAFAGYSEHMDEARVGIAGATTEFWTASLYSQWLRTLQPLLERKGDGFPAFMRGQAWTRKDLLTFLGSYAELKHDTVLYSKQAMAEAGGGWIDEIDDRGYVEPEVLVYARLAALTAATSRGLTNLGMLGEEDAYNLGLLSDLATMLRTISEKELRDEVLTDDEYELIRSFGVQLEHFWQEVFKGEATSEYFTTKDFPAAVVTDVATDPNGSVLELGTGRPMLVYALVPVDGTLRIAVGSIYSFYQFPWPLDDRLTDSKWRRILGIEMGEDGSWPEATGDAVPQDWTHDITFCWSDWY